MRKTIAQDEDWQSYASRLEEQVQDLQDEIEGLKEEVLKLRDTIGDLRDPWELRED